MGRPLKGAYRKKIKITRVCPAGIGHERMLSMDSHYDGERLFRLAWQSLHEGPMYGGSTSCDLLSGLLQEGRRDRMHPLYFPQPISHRDRVVAATVIQWLGTNVGLAFVGQVMKELEQRDDLSRFVEMFARPWPVDPKTLVPRLKGRFKRKRHIEVAP